MPENDGLPVVSVIIPCRNEEAYIQNCIHSVLGSDYPKDKLDILICDGKSNDRTAEIIRVEAQKNNTVKYLFNEFETTPYGLNLGIRNVKGNVILILGAHAAIDELVSQDHIFKMDLTVSEEGGDYGLFKKFLIIKNIINTLQPHFVNPHYIASHGTIAALVRSKKNRNYKLIQTAWGSDILVTPFRNKLYELITKFALNRANLITSDSQHMSGVNTGSLINSINKVKDQQVQIMEGNRRLIKKKAIFPTLIKKYVARIENL